MPQPSPEQQSRQDRAEIKIRPLSNGFLVKAGVKADGSPDWSAFTGDKALDYALDHVRAYLLAQTPKEARR